MPINITGPAARILALLFAAVLPSAASPAEPTQVLRAAYIDFPPLSYTDESGKPAGEGIELTQSVAREAGYELEWREYPLGRIYHSFQNGLIDLWPGSSGVPAIQPYTLETRKAPGMSTRLYAYHLEPTPGVQSLEQIQNRRLILIRGYTYLNKLDKLREANQDIVVAPNHRSGLRLLALNRGDYLLDFGRPLEEAAKSVRVENLQRSLLDEWRLALVVSKKLPDAQAVVERLDQAFTRLFSDRCEPPDCQQP